jgi:hypothetical protein
MTYSHFRLVSLWEMLDHKAGAFHKLSVLLSVFSAHIHSLSVGGHPLEPSGKAALLDALTEMRVHLTQLGCRMSLMELGKLETYIKSDGFGSLALITPVFNSFESRITDELEAMIFFAIEPSKQHYFDQKQPLFGPEVASKFSSLKYEIEEAGKCLAVDRSTASAYHAIRCLEGGFAAVWRCLGITDPLSGFERNWSNRLRKVEDEIERRWPAKSGRMTENAKFFDQVIGMLKGMQNPYRNSSMHLDDVYTEERARHILELVKGVMQLIASKMDENGDPRAP